MLKTKTGMIGLLALWALSLPAMGATPEERERALAEIAAVQADEEKNRAAFAAGKERSLFCSSCHGPTGNSTRAEIPNLAEQNPAYLLEQIGKFADGRRKNFVMNTLAKDFTTEDMVNLAVFFSENKLVPQESDPVMASRGRELFQSKCSFCHGEDGRGAEGYARIAGQKPVYVESTLKRFRANAQNQTSAFSRIRSSQRMEQVTQSLTDDQIQALAAYLAQLK